LATAVARVSRAARRMGYSAAMSFCGPDAAPPRRGGHCVGRVRVRAAPGRAWPRGNTYAQSEVLACREGAWCECGLARRVRSVTGRAARAGRSPFVAGQKTRAGPPARLASRPHRSLPHQLALPDSPSPHFRPQSRSAIGSRSRSARESLDKLRRLGGSFSAARSGWPHPAAIFESLALDRLLEPGREAENGRATSKHTANAGPPSVQSDSGTEYARWDQPLRRFTLSARATVRPSRLAARRRPVSGVIRRGARAQIARNARSWSFHHIEPYARKRNPRRSTNISTSLVGVTNQSRGELVFGKHRRLDSQ
jgi:hypothetical protein